MKKLLAATGIGLAGMGMTLSFTGFSADRDLIGTDYGRTAKPSVWNQRERRKRLRQVPQLFKKFIRK
jgi:hypothetical protein